MSTHSGSNRWRRIARPVVIVPACFGLIGLPTVALVIFFTLSAGDGDFPSPGPVEPIDPSPAPVEPIDSVMDTQPMPPGRPVAPRPLDPIVVDEIKNTLPWGNAAFGSPESMRFNETELLELLVSPSASAEELEAMIKSSQPLIARAEALVKSKRIQVSNLMEAQLSGTGFEIQGTRPARQAVSKDKPTRWTWLVTAVKAGEQHLDLTLSAVIELGHREGPLVIKTFGRDITVVVTWPQRIAGFFAGNWKWLWTAILVPIAVYWWRRSRKNNGTQATSQSPSPGLR